MERGKRSKERGREQREGSKMLGRREKAKTEGKKTSHLAVHTNMACGKKIIKNNEMRYFKQWFSPNFKCPV